MHAEEKTQYTTSYYMYLTLGFAMWGGQYGYITVSKFGLHHVATHSPICNHNIKDKRSPIMQTKHNFDSVINKMGNI